MPKMHVEGYITCGAHKAFIKLVRDMVMCLRIPISPGKTKIDDIDLISA